MRQILSAISLAVLMLAMPAAAAYDPDSFVGRGAVRAVRWIEGDVLLQNERGFRHVILDDDATIHDAYGATMALRDLPLGSEVDYVGLYREGLTVASFVRVRAQDIAVSAR